MTSNIQVETKYESKEVLLILWRPSMGLWKHNETQTQFLRQESQQKEYHERSGDHCTVFH